MCATEKTLQDSQGLRLLRAYFTGNGLLLCNDSKELPSVFTVGGQWEDIVALLEQGEVFYSKLYKGRVTYLSRELYHRLKPRRRREETLSPKAAEMLELIRGAGSATTPELKAALALSSKAYTGCMDELFRELLVTVVARDRAINNSWSSFCWGPAERWEALRPSPPVEPCDERIRELLSGIMTERQIQALLR